MCLLCDILVAIWVAQEITSPWATFFSNLKGAIPIFRTANRARRVELLTRSQLDEARGTPSSAESRHPILQPQILDAFQPSAVSWNSIYKLPFWWSGLHVTSHSITVIIKHVGLNIQCRGLRQTSAFSLSNCSDTRGLCICRQSQLKCLWQSFAFEIWHRVLFVELDLPVTLLQQNRKTKMNHCTFLQLQVANEI